MTVLRQRQNAALRALEIVARHHGVDLAVEALVHDHAIESEVIAPQALLRVARAHGFQAQAATLTWDELAGLREAYPVVAPLTNGNCVVLAGFRPDNGGEVVLHDPLADSPEPLYLPRDRFLAVWQGDVIFLKREFPAKGHDRPFGPRWFATEILGHGTGIGHVVLAGVLLHGFGLLTPVFFQTVIDRVLAAHADNTLTVLGIGVALAMGFEALIRWLRDWLVLHATAKVDIRLTTRTVAHLLRLPLAFFDGRAAGALAGHLAQGERVRDLLAGTLAATALDGTGVAIVLAVLTAYSPMVAALVVGFAAVVAAVATATGTATRADRAALDEAESARDGQVVEALHGIHTVKSLALEPSLRKRWGDRAAAAITLRQRLGKVSIGASAVIGLAERLLTVAVIWIGAAQVFAGRLSLGELVLIQMLAARAAHPLGQMAARIEAFRHAGLSVRRLGAIMTHAPEQPGPGLRPVIKGAVAVEGLTFFYPGASQPALDDVSLTIAAGATVAVVGPSGSGKTTLVRLLQGLAPPHAGHIRFDGVDVRALDLAHLRRALGVVPDEGFLFRGSVRENIAVTLPGAAFSEVVMAATMAGADAFIRRLPQGYDTMLDEGGANLSGGQKRLVAMTRAVLTRPTLLVVDSSVAPDAHSLAALGRGRSVVVATQHLAGVAHADTIVVLDQGRVVATGPHARLLDDCPLYRQMWQDQNPVPCGPSPVTP